MAGQPLLNLDTLIVRQTIAIDDEIYEILSADELSVLASHRFSIRGRQIDLLQASEDEEDSPTLDELIDKVARDLVVDIPSEVFEKLTGAQKWAIVDVFTGLLVRSKLGVVGAMATAMGTLPIGATSFPDSSVSLAASRDGGWRKRLRRWFGRT